MNFEDEMVGFTQVNYINGVNSIAHVTAKRR